MELYIVGGAQVTAARVAYLVEIDLSFIFCVAVGDVVAVGVLNFVYHPFEYF